MMGLRTRDTSTSAKPLPNGNAPSEPPIANSLKSLPRRQPHTHSLRRHSRLKVAAGWLIHFYTASGILVNFYCLLHAFMLSTDFHLFARLNWLAIFIDATDGTLARAIDIKKVVPQYDGALLDNIIDFTTFALLPALSVVRFELVPGIALQMFLSAAMLIGSAYAFCQTMAKTDEAFVGFPSYWNIVVFYIYYLRSSPIVTTVVVLTCAILSFIPIHFIYPTRTRAYQIFSLAGAYVWATLMLFVCVRPEHHFVKPVLRVSLIYVLYYVIMSLHLDHLRRRKLRSPSTEESVNLN